MLGGGGALAKWLEYFDLCTEEHKRKKEGFGGDSAMASWGGNDGGGV